MKVTTLEQFENGIGRVADKLNQYASKTELAGKLDSDGKAETAGTADNAIRDGEGNVITSTYLKKSDNVTVDLSDYQTAAQADAKYLGKNDTAANSEKATKDGQNRNIADTYLEKSVWKEFGVSSANKAGTEGYVPAPPATSDTKILTNFGWTDPQNTQISISTIPSQNGSVTYDGTAKTPTWLNYDPLKLQISGDYQNKTNAGTYPVGFKPLGIYTWSNGTQDIQYTTWTIGKAAGRLSLSAESGSVNIDATSTFTVDREGDGAITVTSSNSNIVTTSVNGNTVTITGKAAGSATITVKVAEGTNHFAPADKTFAVTVTKIPLNLSASISSAVTYNLTGTITLNGNAGGGAVTATSANSSCVTVSSTTTSTVTVKCANYSAATTQITINVAETTKYTSGTTTCNVTTAKATPTLTLSAESVVLTSATPSATVTVTTNSTGALSATSSDSFCCSTAVNDKTISITALSHNTSFVTVTIAETNNFLATSKNISVDTRNFAINMLKGRTLAQLKTLIQTGQAPKYFQVGDYFDFTFQTEITLLIGTRITANCTVRAVCIGINHNSDIEGNNRVHFCICKNSYNQYMGFYYMPPDDMEDRDRGWEETSLRLWLNDTFYNALPNDLKNVISDCPKYTDNKALGRYDTTSVTLLQDKIWLMSETECASGSNFGNIYEATKQQQYEFIKNGNFFNSSWYSQEHTELSTDMVSTRTLAYYEPWKGTNCRVYFYPNSGTVRCAGVDNGATFLPCFTIG